MQRMTVRELIKHLLDEDMDALVAFENFDGTGRTILVANCWQAETFYMMKEPQVQKEYLMEDEIPPDKKHEYVKVLVLGALNEEGK